MILQLTNSVSLMILIIVLLIIPQLFTLYDFSYEF